MYSLNVKINIVIISFVCASFLVGYFSNSIVDWRIMLGIVLVTTIMLVLRLSTAKLSIIGLVLLIFLPPPNYLPLNFGPLNTNVLLLGIVFFSILVRKLISKENFFYNNQDKNMFLGIAFLPFVMMLSIVNADYPLSTFYQVIRFTFTSVVIFYVVKELITKKHIGFVINALIYMMSFVSLLAIIEYLLGYNFIYNNILNQELENLKQFQKIYRAYATTSLPNVLATLIAAIIPFVIYKLHFAESRPIKLLYLSIIIINLSALLMTFSRMALLSMLISLILVIVFSKYKLRCLFYILGIVMILLVTLPLFNIPIFEKITFRFDADTFFDSGSYWHRMYKFSSALMILNHHFLLGVGWGNYTLVADNPLYSLPGDPIALSVFDNQYLQILGETGVLGFISFIIILIMIFFTFSKSTSALNNQSKKLMLSIIASMIVILMNNFILEGFMWNSINILFWLVVGLGSILLRDGRISENKNRTA